VLRIFYNQPSFPSVFRDTHTLATAHDVFETGRFNHWRFGRAENDGGFRRGTAQPGSIHGLNAVIDTIGNSTRCHNLRRNITKNSLIIFGDKSITGPDTETISNARIKANPLPRNSMANLDGLTGTNEFPRHRPLGFRRHRPMRSLLHPEGNSIGQAETETPSYIGLSHLITHIHRVIEGADLLGLMIFRRTIEGGINTSLNNVAEERATRHRSLSLTLIASATARQKGGQRIEPGPFSITAKLGIIHARSLFLRLEQLAQETVSKTRQEGCEKARHQPHLRQ